MIINARIKNGGVSIGDWIYEASLVISFLCSARVSETSCHDDVRAHQLLPSDRNWPISIKYLWL